ESRRRRPARLQQREAGLPLVPQALADPPHGAGGRQASPPVRALRPALRAGAEDRGPVSAAQTRPQPNLLRLYEEQAAKALVKEFDYDNPMQVPRVAKVIVNIGIGEAKDNARALEAAVNDVRTITGQQPIVVKARKSVAAF